MNFFDAIRDRNALYAPNAAVRTSEGAISYGSLLQQVERLADVFRQFGLVPGNCLGVVDRNSPEFIIAMLAGLKCDAVVLPIASNLTASEQEQLIHEAGLHAVLRESASGAVVIGVRIYALKLFAREQPRIAPHVPDAAFIRFTSGTTGTSKGVVIGHRSVIERVEAANTGLQLGPGDAVVWVLPMAYHFVVSVMLYLYHGVTIVLSEDFTAEQIVRAAEASNAVLLYAAPMHVRLLVSDPTCTSLGPLQRVISTSAGSSPELCASFFKKFGLPVSQAFGIIEVGLPIINLRSATEHPEAVGHALPDFEVAILDDALHPIPDGTVGQLALRGPGMFDGYLAPPVLRGDILRDGWFLTGDLATRGADGLITVRGRSKSMINVAGNKVFPEEVEAVINAHPFVVGSRVRGGAHALLGEIVEADVVLKADVVLDVEDLIAHCRKHLTVHKLPQRIHFVQTLEMTATGKVKRG